ncbi:MAG: DUF6106 family protein [Lachnospiraceae bacterium]
MNNDIYAEWLVKRKTPSYAIFLKVGLVLLVLAGIVISTLSPFGFVALLLAVGGAYLGFRSLKVEYEYVFVTNELTIDRIQNQEKRKRMKAMEMSKIEIVAPLESHELDFTRNNPKVKTVDFSSKIPENKKYGVVYSDQGNTFLYIFEPNEKLLNAMKLCAPRKIIM